MDSRPEFYKAARKHWLAYGLYALLALAGLLTSIWATWLNVSSAWAVDGLSSAHDASSPTSIPSLPVYAPAQSETSLSRKANIYTVFPVRPRVDVVRYTVQTGDSVFQGVFRGENQNMGLAPFRSNLLEYLQPVHTGQHQIENNHIIVIIHGIPQSFLTVTGDIDGKAGFVQSLTDGFLQGWIIFNK